MTFNWQRTLLFVALILGLNAAFLFFYPPSQPEPVVSIPYSLFKQELKNGQVKEVLLQGENLSGQFAAELELTAAQAIDAQFKGKQKFSRFKTVLPPLTDAELMPLLDKFKVRVRAEPVQGTSLGSRILIGVLPWVLIIGVWWYIIRKAQQKGGIGGGLLQRFSKSGAQLYGREQ